MIHRQTKLLVLRSCQQPLGIPYHRIMSHSGIIPMELCYSGLQYQPGHSMCMNQRTVPYRRHRQMRSSSTLKMSGTPQSHHSCSSTQTGKCWSRSWNRCKRTPRGHQQRKLTLLCSLAYSTCYRSCPPEQRRSSDTYQHIILRWCCRSSTRCSCCRCSGTRINLRFTMSSKQSCSGYSCQYRSSGYLKCSTSRKYMRCCRRHSRRSTVKSIALRTRSARFRRGSWSRTTYSSPRHTEPSRWSYRPQSGRECSPEAIRRTLWQCWSCP